MRRLVVTWPNSTHDFLVAPQLVVKERENVLDPISKTPGSATSPARFEFEIQDDGSLVFVELSFSTRGAKVFYAGQILKPGATDLVPDDHYIMVDASGATRLSTGLHPLMTLGSDPANIFSAVSVLRINTEFVNVTEIWKNIAGRHGNAYQALHEPGVELVVLGYTGGAPLLWMASVPRACQNTGDVSSLVFFRPELPGAYTTIDDAKLVESAYPLNRFLLSPDNRASQVISPGGFILSLDQFAGDLGPKNQNQISFQHVCASFEAALSRSGKPVVLLQPWAQSGATFGDAPSELLYEGRIAQWPASGGRTPLVESALALLQSQSKIARGHTLKLKRRGLAGFSAGGYGLWDAFSKNKKQVQELYSFDCKDSELKADLLAQWARVTPDFRLRLTGAFQMAENRNIVQTVEKAITAPGSATGQVSAHCSTVDFFLPPARGGSAWWDYVLSNSPKLRAQNELLAAGNLTDPKLGRVIRGFWHQFSVFGGEIFDAATSPPKSQPGPKSQTFLEMFLRDSGF